jgi:hypothetical protein
MPGLDDKGYVVYRVGTSKFGEIFELRNEILLIEHVRLVERRAESFDFRQGELFFEFRKAILLSTSSKWISFWIFCLIGWALIPRTGNEDFDQNVWLLCLVGQVFLSVFVYRFVRIHDCIQLFDGDGKVKYRLLAAGAKQEELRAFLAGLRHAAPDTEITDRSRSILFV